MPRLSPEQADALRSLEWLLSPDERRDGRTTVIAIAAIRVAAAHPRMAVAVRDHHPGARVSGALVAAIEDFVGDDDRLRIACRWNPLRGSNPSLIFDLVEPIREWMPQSWEPPHRSARVRDIPFRLSLDPRARVSRPEQTEWGVDLSEDTVNALIYALEASKPPPEPPARSLWDYLEDS